MDNFQNSESSQKPNKNNKISLSFDFRVIIGILLVIIVAMLIIWKPWTPVPDNNDRVVSVEGQAKITAEPDEFVFNPFYEFKSSTKKAALDDLTTKSDEIIKELKKLGVADNKIKTNSSGYNYEYYYNPRTKVNNYSLSLTVTATNREMAQKVQDYLVSTKPTGTVSPQANFSDQKRKELESQARDEATKDARAKADQSAKNLGFKLGSVKSVDDGNGFNIPDRPYYGGALYLQSGASEDKSLAVQPGENDLVYSVKVTYFVK